ncbi:MAG: hypothetical protein PT956_01015 [Firmicutes bacterium]|nr:hypothetical protein [Bacillota bacterium]
MNELFRDNIMSLKDISIDNHDPKNPEYMTESEYMAINFDKVKEAYVRTRGIYYHPKSSDAIVIDDNKITMIEFKNGVIDRELTSEIREKMLNSVLIYCDLEDKSLGFTREHVDYILVYNYKKNPFDPNDKKYRYQMNVYRDKIKKNIFKKANMRFKQFGLEIYEKYLFNNVLTYSMRDFHDYFTSRLPEE